jgi:8-oxo-dGTP pyrophosphatase MutT (NUDIX family)
MSEPVVKYSYGLACVLPGVIPKILFIKRRLTYAFFDFIMGRYQFNELRSMFNMMTYNEKTEILELDFDRLWKRLIGINADAKRKIDIDSYTKKKARFEKVLPTLKALMNNTTDADPVWEIPKGGQEKNEKPLSTAIREFEEETLIGVDYTLLECKPLVQKYKHGKTTYVSSYFVAVVKKYEESGLFSSYHCNLEVECSRWFSMKEIEFLNRGQINRKRILDLSKRVFATYRKNKPLWAKSYVFGN